MKVVVVASSNLIRKNLIVLFSAITVIVCFAFLQRSVFAEEASNSADPVKKFNITFPVSTLGNCNSLEACKAYCEDPVNQAACLNFARSKGFYKSSQGQNNARSRLIIEKAKIELGCNTEDECKALCSSEENAQKCADFAKKYSIEKKKVTNNSILEKAKAALGCTSEETCKTMCQQEANREKCSQFAKSAGLPGGMVKIASMSGKDKEGLNQVNQMIEKCLKDPKFCEENIGTIEKQLMQKSDEFCKSNPEKCKEFLKGLKEASKSGKFTPNSAKAYENANANAKFCRENPEKCRNASGSAKIALPDRPEIKKPQVQGVSTVRSIFDQVFDFFFK